MTKKIVFFNELSEDAKEKARNWYKDGNDYDFLDEYMTEIVAENLKELGYMVEDLKVFYSLSYSQGDGVSFVCKLVEGLEVYEVNQGGSYVHEMTMSIYHEDENGNETDGEKEKNLLVEVRNIAKKAEKAGYEYIESEDSNENIDATILANEYTFTLEGERMNPDA